jgi:CDP-diglyceride synthetase
MDELFTKKVRAAAVAGWWTLLIAFCILLIQWPAYLLIMTRQPAGILCFWGEGVTWSEIRTIWGRFGAVYSGKTTGKKIELTVVAK